MHCIRTVGSFIDEVGEDEDSARINEKIHSICSFHFVWLFYCSSSALFVFVICRRFSFISLEKRHFIYLFYVQRDSPLHSHPRCDFLFLFAVLKQMSGTEVSVGHGRDVLFCARRARETLVGGTAEERTVQ